MAKRALRKAKTAQQACAIGYSKARKLKRGKSTQQKACGAEIRLFKKGMKSPRRLVTGK